MANYKNIIRKAEAKFGPKKRAGNYQSYLKPKPTEEEPQFSPAAIVSKMTAPANPAKALVPSEHKSGPTPAEMREIILERYAIQQKTNGADKHLLHKYEMKKKKGQKKRNKHNKAKKSNFTYRPSVKSYFQSLKNAR